jgi:hypothetical protein
VLREVVVNDQHVATRFHEMLRDAGRGVRSDVGKAWRVVALGHHDDGVSIAPFSRRTATVFATAEARWPMAQ